MVKNFEGGNKQMDEPHQEIHEEYNLSTYKLTRKSHTLLYNSSGYQFIGWQ